VREYRFLQVDVFTDVAFGGNPLAVFPDAEGLASDEMQKLAREINLSETTFVLPPEDTSADFKVRIFTPAVEMPFAGHPVVGTHWVLAHLGRVDLKEPVTEVRFELGVGVLPAELEVAEGRVQRVMITSGQPTFLETLEDLSDLAEGLGLPVEAITETRLPVQVVSTGLPSLMVPVRSLAEVQALDAGRLNVAALARACETVATNNVLVFTRETEDPGATVHARFFAPMLGVAEDPATGSANCTLGAYLVHHQVVPVKEGTNRFVSEQGAEMGRPSRLHILVDVSQGEITRVRVGGNVVLVLEGTVRRSCWGRLAC
jgi:trans-2,3-dihydro-3-hydroxyanthranilate isomerase